ILPVGEMPNPDGLIVTAGSNAPAIRSKGQGRYRASMSVKTGKFLARGQRPQSHRAITTSRGQGCAVGRKNHGVDLILMAKEGRSLGAIFRVPQFHGTIVTCGGYGPAVRGKAQAPNESRLPVKAKERLTILYIPNRYVVITNRGKPTAIGTKCRRAHSGGDRLLLSGDQIAQPQIAPRPKANRSPRRHGSAIR